MTGQAPLIVTVSLDKCAQQAFDTLRARHFPPERNFVPAHLTLFHKLPGHERVRVGQDLAAAAGRTERLNFHTAGAMDLGRGAALRIVCPPLPGLRSALAAVWADWLAPQDRAGLKPHVTVQNKVDRETALGTLAHLAALPEITGDVTGLLLWRYLGGPWELEERYPFRTRSGGIE
ncbi:2'-5' RNA ligase family protein [Roseitranquillus sediminis]|uniref:2'-5' RNA ligase family protein n=1 Tax=Roseitranquillus sediminis TaxID=2809051 RepID=UPI001D0C2694|nr:2'-5' RNA ligase family protein [Roseitranquillus sediminis]MBM9595525.1 2'-5' RNA ligase family protein [Roseitranquillus sediminis]